MIVASVRSTSDADKPEAGFTPKLVLHAKNGRFYDIVLNGVSVVNLPEPVDAKVWWGRWNRGDIILFAGLNGEGQIAVTG